MDDSDFWRDLAVSFQSASKIREFTACRYYYLGGGGEPDWQFEGFAGDNEAALAEFHSMAGRGASRFAIAPTGDLSFAWLEALWEEATHGPVRSASEILEGGSDLLQGKRTVPVRLRGKIDYVFKASFALCRKLESQVIYAEVEERRRNEPRNWSPFRQQIEAYQSAKKITNESPLQIPETAIKNAIARIYGITPEEVTDEQIKFEVSGLLSSIRHIKVIPSTPALKSPPIPEENIDNQVEEKAAQPKTFAPIVAPPPVPTETVAVQLQKLRDECRWTIEDLASATGLSDRQIARHLSGEYRPLPRNISAYEREFSKRLKRQVVINKMS